MTARGIDFLEDWIARNVTTADFQGTSECAVQLADLCIAEAAAQGLNLANLAPEWGSVDGIIFQVMRNDPGGGTPGD